MSQCQVELNTAETFWSILFVETLLSQEVKLLKEKDIQNCQYFELLTIYESFAHLNANEWNSLSSVTYTASQETVVLFENESGSIG